MSLISLDLGSISYEAFRKVAAMDRCNVGTPDYMGVAGFWDSAFKSTLREMTSTERRQVHRYLLENGAVVKSYELGFMIDSQHPANHDLYVEACQRFRSES
jgi:hypothetical protein